MDLSLGSAVFAFEGVALIIPVYDAMENKSHLNSVLISSMIFISFVTFIMGIMPYISFGPSGIQETVTQFIISSLLHNRLQLLMITSGGIKFSIYFMLLL